MLMNEREKKYPSIGDCPTDMSLIRFQLWKINWRNGLKRVNSDLYSFTLSSFLFTHFMPSLYKYIYIYTDGNTASL